jgi:hypothetical protein
MKITDRLIQAAVCLVVGALAYVLSHDYAHQVQAEYTPAPMNCNSSVPYDASTNGATRLVASSTGVGGPIFICGYTIGTNTATNVKLIYGTGTTCGTGTTSITPAYTFAANTAGYASVTEASPFFRGLVVPSGNDLCINTSAGNAVQAIVYYYQQRG